MAATVIELLQADQWADISAASGQSGFITNTGSQEVIYVEAVALPVVSDIFGHKLKVGESVNYAITAGAVYARTVARADGVLAVTGE